MAGVSPVLVALISVALAFDFLNGLHDAANSIATIVSTRVLRPQYAVFWAAFFNFIAFAFFGLHVANTVGGGIVDVHIVDDRLIFAALAGAIVWNILTWVVGMPSSSSHALIGGLVGAGLRQGGAFGHRLERDHQDQRGHCAFADSRLFSGARAGRAGVLDLLSEIADCSGFHISGAAILLGLALFSRPWRQ